MRCDDAVLGAEGGRCGCRAGSARTKVRTGGAPAGSAYETAARAGGGGRFRLSVGGGTPRGLILYSARCTPVGNPPVVGRWDLVWRHLRDQPPRRCSAATLDGWPRGHSRGTPPPARGPLGMPNSIHTDLLYALRKERRSWMNGGPRRAPGTPLSVWSAGGNSSRGGGHAVLPCTAGLPVSGRPSRGVVRVRRPLWRRARGTARDPPPQTPLCSTASAAASAKRCNSSRPTEHIPPTFPVKGSAPYCSLSSRATPRWTHHREPPAPPPSSHIPSRPRIHAIRSAGTPFRRRTASNDDHHA